MGKKHKKQEKARKKERKAVERKALSPAERFDALLDGRWFAGSDGAPDAASNPEAKPAKRKKHGKHAKHTECAGRTERTAPGKPEKAAMAGTSGKHRAQRATESDAIKRLPTPADARTATEAPVGRASGSTLSSTPAQAASKCDTSAPAGRAAATVAPGASRVTVPDRTAVLPSAAARASLPAPTPRRAAFRTVAGAWDLHSHSVFSDGSCTPEELIAEALEAGLERLAITDHDSLRQLSAVRACARRLNFPVLAGTEVSARDYVTGRNVHILAFGLEATSDGSGPLERLVNDTLYQRTANTLWQAWVLKRCGAEFSGRYISLDDVVETAGQSLGVYKQHVMESLTHRHHEDPDYQFFYQCQFKGESPANHDIRYPAAADAVRAVREQGGVPVLAHPGQMNSWASLPELVQAGLLGIEAYHPDHGAVEEELAFEAAARYGLFVTGGSDYHGKYGAPAALGEAFVMPEEAGEAVEQLFRRERELA